MNMETRKSWPFEEERFCIIGIDPGSITMGISVLEVDDHNNAFLVWAETIKATTFIKKYEEIAERHTDRFARLYGYSEQLVKFMDNWTPDAVVCEANFLGHHANAFASLTETVLIIRQATIKHNFNTNFSTVDPPSLKLSVGVAAGARDKELVRTAIRNLPISYLQPQRLESLDEHSCDAIAAAYWRYLKYIGRI